MNQFNVPMFARSCCYRSSQPLCLPVLGLLLLAGCGALHDFSEEVHEEDSVKCQEIGWEVDTAEHSECVEKEYRERMETEGKMPDSLLDGGWWIGTWF